MLSSSIKSFSPEVLFPRLADVEILQGAHGFDGLHPLRVHLQHDVERDVEPSQLLCAPQCRGDAAVRRSLGSGLIPQNLKPNP